MKSQKVTFKNEKGQELAARLDFPNTGKPSAYALFAHCFTCTKNLKAIRNINTSLTQAGFAVLRFDFTGLGESEGEFADTNFSSNVEDLIAAAQYIEENYEAPDLLVGHSLGGSAVLLAAKEIDSVKAIATIGAPSEPVHVKKQFDDDVEQIETEGALEVELGGRPFTIKKQFLDDLESVNMEEHIKALKKALLVMHSPQDKIVDIDNAARIYKAAMHPKSFITLDGSDHLLSQKADSLYAGQMIASWATRYLDITDEQEETLTTDEKVVVKTGSKEYTSRINAEGHYLLADEPESKGGNDLGPTPYGLLSAALGACTAITLRMYANRKEWPVESIKVHLNHEKVHADDCDDCDNPKSKFDQITRIIELEGDLDEKQRERMLYIANKCPVHKTLTEGEVKIESSLKDE